MEKRRYYVMRKDEIITLASFDNEGKMLDYAEPSSPRQIEIAPLAYRTLGHDWLKKWWKERSIPLTRDQIQGFLKENGYSAPSEYLIKNLGLSLTDYYWVKPVDSDLSWNDINLYKNDFHDDIFMPDLEYNETDTPRYSPNSSWDCRCTDPLRFE